MPVYYFVEKEQPLWYSATLIKGLYLVILFKTEG